MSKLDYETVRARTAGLTRALDGILVNAADHGFTGTDFTNHRGTQTRHGGLEDARPVSLDALPPPEAAELLGRLAGRTAGATFVAAVSAFMIRVPSRVSKTTPVDGLPRAVTARRCGPSTRSWVRRCQDWLVTKYSA
jgi:hypothetical protein